MRKYEVVAESLLKCEYGLDGSGFNICIKIISVCSAIETTVSRIINKTINEYCNNVQYLTLVTLKQFI